MRENQRHESGEGLREKLVSDEAGGCWLPRRLRQVEVSTTKDLGTAIFFYFCMTCGLEKLGLLDPN